MSNRHQTQRMKVEETGDFVAVPNDSVARLMYYLSCISTIGAHSIPGNLTNYTQPHTLSKEEKLQAVKLARRLRPESIPGFLEVPTLPDGSSNSFMKFSTVDETIAALGISSGDTRMAGLRGQIGRTQTLVHIMAYTPDWITHNYKIPLEEAGKLLGYNSTSLIFASALFCAISGLIYYFH